MAEMNAAVVTDFTEPPHYRSFTVPTPAPGNHLARVLAAGLHPRVRSGAAGVHYTSTGALPLVPGVDAVARRDDGRLIYFIAGEDTGGTMAEQAEVDPRRAIELPAGTDPPAVATIAAAMNPAMSSWVALRRRIKLTPGQSVLVIGATGNAGAMAIQIARLLGAGEVIAAGRNQQRLTDTPADRCVSLSDDPRESAQALAAEAAEVDVVIDYLWGATTEHTIPALLRARRDRSKPLDWIQIGAITGPDITLPSAALRSANLRLMGSGQGSVSGAAYAGELPSLVEAIVSGAITVEVATAPLAEVEAVWQAPEGPGIRTVFIP